MKRKLTHTTALLAVIPITYLMAAPQQKVPAELQEAMEDLSAATAPGGGGPEAYARILTEDFTRWTLGSERMDDRDSWVEGVRAWYGDGWRVADRKTRRVDLELQDDLAFVRRIVTETYSGPEGEESSATAALAEIWERTGNGWRLKRVDAHAVD